MVTILVELQNALALVLARRKKCCLQLGILEVVFRAWASERWLYKGFGAQGLVIQGAIDS